MTEREALKLALEALEQLKGELYEEVYVNGLMGVLDKPIAAIKEALAQPEQEQKPAAKIYAELSKSGGLVGSVWWLDQGLSVGNYDLYTTPPQRTWVGLTPQERDEINEQVYGAVPHHVAFHAAIEAKLKEKNT